MNRTAFFIAGFFAVTVSSAASAQGNADSGRAIFQGRCGLCHWTENIRGTALGPTLDGFYGQKAAQRSDYFYTDALKNAGLTWDNATLDKWLADPAALVPGTRMNGFTGIKTEQGRADMIAYLSTLTPK